MAVRYSPQVLEETPARVTKFLQGLGALPIVRTLMASNGMTDDDITEGRKLLLACLAEPLGAEPNFDTAHAKASRDAVAELDAWDEPNFAKYRAALRRRAPSAEEYVFADLKSTSGPESVNGVATFLARVTALEKGDDASRRGSRKGDEAAVALLESRGLTKAERKRLHHLVETALGPTAALPVLPAADDEVRRAKLTTLKDWYEDWSATARAVVKKRSYLIRLGLATRKVRKPPKGGGGEGGEGGEDVPTD